MELKERGGVFVPNYTFFSLSLCLTHSQRERKGEKKKMKSTKINELEDAPKSQNSARTPKLTYNSYGGLVVSPHRRKSTWIPSPPKGHHHSPLGSYQYSFRQWERPDVGKKIGKWVGAFGKGWGREDHASITWQHIIIIYTSVWSWSFFAGPGRERPVLPTTEETSELGRPL